MTLQNKLHLKRFGLLVVPVLLTLLMVTLPQKKASAVPLKPILNQVIRDIVEGVLNGDSPTQATPSDRQPSPNADQEEPGSSDSIPSTDPPIYPVSPPSAAPVSPTSPLIYSPSLTPSFVAPTFVYSAPPDSGYSAHPSVRPLSNESQNRGTTARKPALRKRSKKVILKRQSHKVPVVHSVRRRS